MDQIVPPLFNPANPIDTAQGTLVTPTKRGRLVPVLVFLVAGILVGIGITTLAIWLRPLLGHGQYTCWAEYQVLMPEAANPPTTNPAITENFIDAIIQRHALIFTSDAVLDEALKTDAFQFDYHDRDKPAGSRHPSAWMIEHATDPRTALRDETKVTRVPGTDLFRIELDGKDPKDVDGRFNALQTVYENMLKSIRTQRLHAELTAKLEERKELQQRVDVAQANLENYREAHQIIDPDTFMQRQRDALAQCDAELEKARDEAAKEDSASAKAHLVEVQARRKDLFLQYEDSARWLDGFRTRQASTKRVHDMLDDLNATILKLEVERPTDLDGIRLFAPATDSASL